MKTRIYRLLFALLGALLSCRAQAQQPVELYMHSATQLNQMSILPIDANNPLPVTGTFSSTPVGFNQTVSLATPITVTSSSGTTSLTSSTEIIVTNVGSNAAYCVPGAGPATASNQYIGGGGSWFSWYATGGITQLSCISPSGTTVNVQGGTGSPAGTGGGSGSGGGGAITSPLGTSTAASAAVSVTQIGGIQGTTPGTAAASGSTVEVQGNASGTPLLIAAASNAFTSGAFAVGSGVDGWNVDLGTLATSAWVSGSTNANMIGLGKAENGFLATIATNTGSSSLPVTNTGSPSATAAAVQGPGVGGEGLPVVTSNTEVSVMPTITASTYTAGYSIGGLMTFAVFGNASQGSGILTDLGVFDADGALNQTAEIIYRYIFRATPAMTCTDHAAAVLSASDKAIMVPGSPFMINTVTPYQPAASGFTVGDYPLSKSVSSSSGTVNLYVCDVVGVTTTAFGATTNYVATIGLVQDSSR